MPEKSTEHCQGPQPPRLWTIHTAAVWLTLPEHPSTDYQTHKLFFPPGGKVSESATLNSRHHLVLHTHTNTLATYIYKPTFFILFNLIFPTLETALLYFKLLLYVICYFWYVILVYVVCRLLRRCWLPSHKNFAALKQFGICDNKLFDFDFDTHTHTHTHNTMQLC